MTIVVKTAVLIAEDLIKLGQSRETAIMAATVLERLTPEERAELEQHVKGD